jgi:hypothetical protein
MKALAAATARSVATPTPRARASELSGMLGRRDSVVGARVEPSPAVVSGVGWNWAALGCLSVLIPGLVGVWYLNRASVASAAVRPAAIPSTGSAAPLHGSVEIEPIAHRPVASPAPEPPAVAAAVRREPVEGKGDWATASDSRAEAKLDRAARHRLLQAKRAASVDDGAVPAPPAPAAAAAPPHEAEPAAPAPTPEKSDDAEKFDKPKKVAEAAPDEPVVGPPKTVRALRAALTRFQGKVVLCHNRFQVDGTADVRVLVSPSGTVESLSLTGDFDGTPTGECIVRQLSAASFPPFDGSESIRISHSFPLE